VTIPEVSTVCFVGAGTMGCYNALAAALSGYRAVLYDVNDASLEAVPARLQEMSAMLIGAGFCTDKDMPAALSRVSVSSDLQQATAGAELVSESVFERLDVKRETHKQLDQLCPAGTILTTNSSALQISQIEDVVKRGDLIAAMHSHLGSPLVDVVPGPRTDPKVIDVLRRYVLSIQGEPLVLHKEHKGYVLNSLLGPLLAVAQGLNLRHGYSIEDIDRVWMSQQEAAMGPFGMIDLFGLELMRDSWQDRAREQWFASLRPQLLAMLQAHIDKGQLGASAGAGFYSYPQPAYQKAGFLEQGPTDSLVYDVLVVTLIAGAVQIAAQDVADCQDIDRAWTVGTWLKDGPFALLHQMGAESFLGRLEPAVAAGLFDRTTASQVRLWVSQRQVVFDQ
jgi:enoyl-CoA hydratase/3-hydroxyacyl-CoA dehydrogenase